CCRRTGFVCIARPAPRCESPTGGAILRGRSTISPCSRRRCSAHRPARCGSTANTRLRQRRRRRRSCRRACSGPRSPSPSWCSSESSSACCGRPSAVSVAPSSVVSCLAGLVSDLGGLLEGPPEGGHYVQKEIARGDQLRRSIADRAELEAFGAQLRNEAGGGFHGVTLIGERCRFVAVVHDDDVAV